MSHRRKGTTLLELLAVIPLLLIIGMISDTLFTPMVQGIPKLQRVSWENECVRNMLKSIQADVEIATALPRSHGQKMAGPTLLLIRQGETVLAYQVKDGKVIREILSPENISVASSRKKNVAETWNLPAAKIQFSIWPKTSGQQAYAVDVQTAVEYRERNYSKDKFANTHVYFLPDANGGTK